MKITMAYNISFTQIAFISTQNAGEDMLKEEIFLVVKL